jgi:hypothetical protein
MDRRHIVPVEPASGDGDVVVVQVQQKGSHPLDVRLVGCEGESPYVTQSKIDSVLLQCHFVSTHYSSQACQYWKVEKQVQGL